MAIVFLNTRFRRAVFWLAFGFFCSAGQAWSDSRIAPVETKEAVSALAATRDSADPRVYRRAEEQVARLVAKAPDDARVLALQAWSMMGRHRFNDALERCERALSQDSAEPLALALRTDALTELGRYDDALAAAQLLLDRGAPLAAYPRAAQLRFLHGDLVGAVALAQRALDMTPPNHPEHAWLARDLARLLLQAGRVNEAKNVFGAMPPVSATDHGLLARVLQAAGDTQGAVTHWQLAYAATPMAEYGVALWKLAIERGDEREVRRLTRLLEGQSRLDSEQGGLSARSFIEFFARSHRLADAERLARLELARRPDVYSEAQLAWVLHSAGRVDEAAEHARRARRLNTPDRDLIEWLSAVPAENPPDGPRSAGLSLHKVASRS